MQQTKGFLYLIPTLLGDTPPALVLPAGLISTVRTLDYFVVEQLRTSRRFLSRIGMEKPIDSLVFFELNKHSKQHELRRYLEPALSGHSVGLMSEAGTPCVADPGSLIVELAHELGIRVVPLSGPNAILMALMASGFNGQKFMFHGYLPINGGERAKTLKALELQSAETGQTQIFIETPYRNLQMLEAIKSHCRPGTSLCVAVNISLPDEYIHSAPLAAWKSLVPDMHKKPAVFLIWSGNHRNST
ncbi:MAG: SAM-dependent methyltransferase [Bacteroidales bacterium]|nr:SAM-dependent methyltransferase [Bacteroidales bacterium]